MKAIEINSRQYSVPECWNELSKKQLLQVIELLYQKNYSPEKTVLKLIKILTGMSWWAFVWAPITSKIGKREKTGLEEYLYLTEFLLTENCLTNQLLPEYGGFAGPADDMINLIMDEFVFSESYYNRWAENRKDTGLLDNFIAILYRPQRRFYNKKKNSKGDVRTSFNEDLCKYYAGKDIKGWPLTVKLAIVHFYEACRQKWVEDNPEVFNGGGGDPAQYGLLSVMRGVAKSGIHGSTLEEVGGKHVNAILMELNEMVAEAREQEKALKK